MPDDDDTVDPTPLGKGRRKTSVREEEDGDPRAGRLPGWGCALLIAAAALLLGGLGGLVYFAATAGGRPTRPDTGTKQGTERPPSPVPSTAAPTPLPSASATRPPAPSSSSPPVDRPAGKGTVTLRASPESPALLAATREGLTAAGKGEAARSKGVADGSVVVLTAPADVELVNRGIAIAVVRHAGRQWVVDVTALGGK